MDPEVYHAAFYIATGAAAAFGLAKAYKSLFAPNLVYKHRHSSADDRGLLVARGLSVLSVGGRNKPKFHEDVFQKMIPQDCERNFEQMVDLAMDEIKKGQILEKSGIDSKNSISELVIHVRR